MYLWLKIKKACAIWFGVDNPNKWLSAVIALFRAAFAIVLQWVLTVCGTLEFFGIYSTTINNNSFLIRFFIGGVNGSSTLYERAVAITC